MLSDIDVDVHGWLERPAAIHGAPSIRPLQAQDRGEVRRLPMYALVRLMFHVQMPAAFLFWIQARQIHIFARSYRIPMRNQHTALLK